MNNQVNIGLLFLSAILSIYGLLGFFGIEVWIRNRGWVEQSFTESMFDFALGLIVFVYVKKFRGR